MFKKNSDIGKTFDKYFFPFEYGHATLAEIKGFVVICQHKQKQE